MKNINILVLIAILTITFSACRKDRGPKAFGFVLASGTGTPIEGATVDLYKGDSFTGPWTLDRTLTTGSDGAYEFAIPDNEAYRVSAYHSEYFETANGYFRLNNMDYAYDLPLTPHAYIKLHVENVAPVNESDNILVGGFVEFPTTDNFGADINITKTIKVRGNQDITFGWRVRENNIFTNYYDTLYVSAHDTLHYEILY